MPYWCTKFGVNQSMRRLFILGSLFLKSARRRKCEENQTIFRNIIYLKTTKPISFKFGVCKVVYLEGTKYANLIEIGSVLKRYEMLKTVTYGSCK